MIQRFRVLFSLEWLTVIEASLIGLFMVQALRYLIGAIYAHVGSASLYPALNPALIDPALPGLIQPAQATNELSFVAVMLLLPLLTFIIGRNRVALIGAAGVAGMGRYLMTANGATMPDIFGAALTVGGSLAYIALIVRHRARLLPYALIFAFSADQIFRAYGDTLDPSWEADYLNVQLVLTVVVIALSLITFAWQSRRDVKAEAELSPDHGLMGAWGGVSFGALLFLQLSLFALPNAIARRADMAYVLAVPLTVIATMLPVVPAIRGQARRFVGIFDSGVRGWVWMLITALLVVLGLRLGGIPSGVALVGAQFFISMMWWWLARPKAKKERNFGDLWLILGMMVFAFLVVFDIFTFEYAFVRDFAEPLTFLNPLLPSLLRGFRGFGIAVILLGVFLAVLPMVTTHKRIAWNYTPRWSVSLAAAVLIAGVSTLAASFARPPVVVGVNNPEVVRVGTYNIHSGMNEFYHLDLEMMARTIQFSGANVILLQEAEAGRLTSYGIDEVLWLARRLNMDARFFPTNEGVQGLAVLSNIEIVYDDRTLLESVGTQTGLQRVQVRPDAGVITVYNLWLEPLLDTGNAATTVQDLEAAQLAQLYEVLSNIRRHYPDNELGRMVIGGTFNNIPTSDVVQVMTGIGFEDPFVEQQPELSATFRRTGVSARLDYLWTTISPNFQVTDASVINDLARQIIPRQASDHLIALIAIRLR